MNHLPVLIEDLSLILIAAAAVVLIFKKLKQPVVLGYLICGMLVGRHIPFMPTVGDTASITVWAEIGVIFLLFGLGLEFSFKKLAAVGKTAATTAIFEILFMLGVGYLVGQVLNWSAMDSLFLGGILSISSTTIIVRAFHELKLREHKFVSTVFGVLIVEDILAILLLVLLTTVAATKSLSGTELALASLRLGFFLVLWFLIGIYLLPTFLKRVRNLLDDETTLVVALGLCLMMVVLAANVGFSPALGAFVMGSILAETSEGKRIEHLLVPVRDLFAAVFFVSVGMLIDPKIIFDHFGTIMMISIVTIVGKFVSSAVGTLLSGKSLKQSVQTGMSLAQIGEFSFIIATLGVTLKVTSEFLYPIAVAVSVVTTFTTPYLIKYSEPFYHWIERKLSASALEQLKRYEMGMAGKNQESVLVLLLKEYAPKIILNLVLVGALSIFISRYALPWFASHGFDNEWLPMACCILALTLSAPFLWAIIISGPAHKGAFQGENLIRLERLQFGVSFVRMVAGLSMVAFIVAQFFSLQSFAGILLALVAVLGVLLSRSAEPLYKALENKFLSNLNESQRSEVKRSPMQPELAPWDASLAEFVVSQNSELVGRPLIDSALREKYGVIVTMIERGQKMILAPGRSEVLFPFDKIYLIGTDDQLTRVKDVIESSREEPQATSSFGLEPMVLQKTSNFIGKPIRNSGLREAVNGLIVGIERAGVRVLNPESDMILQPDDLLWIVGDKSLIKSLRAQRG